MLYQIYETQRSFLQPLAVLAKAISRIFASPLVPSSYLPYASGIAAGYDLFHRSIRGIDKPAFDIASVLVDGTEVTVDEQILLQKPFCQLLHFDRQAQAAAVQKKLQGQPAVLVVAPLSGHYATLLRDTVRTLLQDHSVYVTDWANARDVPVSEGVFSLDDYVHYVQAFIEQVQSRHGKCHVMAVSQAAAPVLAAVSLMASRAEEMPSTVVFLAPQLDAVAQPERLDMAWLERHVIHEVPASYAGAGRRVYPGFLQYTGFMSLNPNRQAGSYFSSLREMAGSDVEDTQSRNTFYDEFNAVQDLDAVFYLDTIRTVFLEHKLLDGSWYVADADGKLEPVRPQDIRHTAMLVVEGGRDNFAGPGQGEAGLSLCTALPADSKVCRVMEDAGHFGVFSGRLWRETGYPIVQTFIAAHHGKKKEGDSLQQAPALVPVAEAPVQAKAVAEPVKKPAKTVARASAAAKKPAASTSRPAAARKTASRSAAKPAQAVAEPVQQSVSVSETQPVVAPAEVTLPAAVESETVAKPAAEAVQVPVPAPEEQPVIASEDVASAQAKPEVAPAKPAPRATAARKSVARPAPARARTGKKTAQAQQVETGVAEEPAIASSAEAAPAASAKKPAASQEKPETRPMTTWRGPLPDPVAKTSSGRRQRSSKT